MKINKDQITFSKWQDFIFSVKRGYGHLIPFLKNRFIWHYFPRIHKVSKFPDHLDIEISSVCDMRCPMCYTITEEFKKNVKRQFMSFELFKKIIDEAVSYNAYSIRLSFRGEPFLNKDIVKIIRYAKEKGIKEIATLSNNLALNPRLFKDAMEAGLDWLTISFDGLYETYEQIRMPAKFETSYNKIKEYARIKKEANSVKPVIKVQSIWPAIKDGAKEYCDKFAPYVDAIASNPLMDYLKKDSEIEYIENFECPVIYQRLSIGSDGVVLQCINDEYFLNPIGDVTTQSIYEIWHGEKLELVRDAHKKRKGVELLAPCKDCYLPRKTQPVVESFGDSKIVVEKFTKRTEKVGE